MSKREDMIRAHDVLDLEKTIAEMVTPLLVEWKERSRHLRLDIVALYKIIDTKDEQIETLTKAARDLEEQLSDALIEKTRLVWGSTIAKIVQRKRNTLRAAIEEAMENG